MLALGVVGLTTYRRSQLKEIHEQLWRELKRTQHRLRVSATRLGLAEELIEDKSNETCNSPSVEFSLELLCGCLLKDQCDNEVPCLTGTEFVRLNWANRSALKGRIAVLNSRSPYLDQLLKRAAGEELAGFAFYGSGEDPLNSVEAASLLKRIEDAMHSAEAKPLPVWLIYGSGAQEIAHANAFRIHSAEEEPCPNDQCFLPGGENGIYDIAWLPESAVVSSAQLSQKVTGVLENISWGAGWDWGWSSPYSSENSLTARMQSMNVAVMAQ